MTAFLKSNNDCAASHSGLHNGEEVVSNIDIDEADKDNWDLDELMNATEADVTGLYTKFRELWTECRVVHFEMLASLADVVKMDKCSIKLEEHVKGCDQDLQKTWRSIQVVKSAIL